jgi:hypothetical protein
VRDIGAVVESGAPRFSGFRLKRITSMLKQSTLTENGRPVLLRLLPGRGHKNDMATILPRDVKCV